MSALHVICRIADAEYAIPAADVYQMENYIQATPVPGAPDYVAGLVQVRQQVIGLLDMRRRLGLPPIPPTSESRIVVLKVGERLVGLLVDAAREVQNIDPAQFKDPPLVVSTQSAGFIKALAQIKDRIIMLLDPEKVIGEEGSHVQA